MCAPPKNAGIFRNLTYYRESWLKVHQYQDFQSGSPLNVLWSSVSSTRSVRFSSSTVSSASRHARWKPGFQLLKKGETSKEIYLLSRLQEVGHESDTPIEDRLVCISI